MKCTYCGQQLDDGAQRCPHCGVPTIRKEKTPTAAYQKLQPEELTNQKGQKLPTQADSRRIMILLCILLAALMVILLAIWGLQKQKDPEPEEAAVTTVQTTASTEATTQTTTAPPVSTEGNVVLTVETTTTTTVTESSTVSTTETTATAATTTLLTEATTTTEAVSGIVGSNDLAGVWCASAPESDAEYAYQTVLEFRTDLTGSVQLTLTDTEQQEQITFTYAYDQPQNQLLMIYPDNSELLYAVVQGETLSLYNWREDGDYSNDIPFYVLTKTD